MDNKAFKNNNLTWYAPYGDLVYLDPPYVWGGAGESDVDYLTKYHFLEGIARYEEWSSLIDRNSPILRIQDGYTRWPGGKTSSSPHLISSIFQELFERYHSRIIVLSYRDNGIPSVNELITLLKRVKQYIYIQQIPYKYALRKQNFAMDSLNELVLVGVNRPTYGLGDQA